MPATAEAAADSVIERYHQDSLESGERIRGGLSRAVEQAILAFANGFLGHPDNTALREAAVSGALSPAACYQHLLRLIYRLLFLMVIEERGLVFPPGADASHRAVYDQFYSLQRLRRLSEKRHLADRRHHDLWLSLLATFRLFEAHGPGPRIGVAPLAGDLFRHDAVGMFPECSLGNDVLLGCLRALGLYSHPDTGQMIRVNYAALNVEEFGSVYEGLLEYEPVFVPDGGQVGFAFARGNERASTGSHYTPDDLVQPLIRHSLDHLIDRCLAEADRAAKSGWETLDEGRKGDFLAHAGREAARTAADPKLSEAAPAARWAATPFAARRAALASEALLSLRIADISCGSGHILLAAARRVATQLAAARTGEEQPSPAVFRAALRDVIRECVYGVDINPLAVELCKVALWLEAHVPGEPLGFLDHHIKCGNAIVGFARHEDLVRGVPDEAFTAAPGDDKETAAALRKTNKAERKDAETRQRRLDFAPALDACRGAVLGRWRELSRMPDGTPAETEAKKARYRELAQSPEAWLLGQVAAIPPAQFYLPKTPDNRRCLLTDAEYRRHLSGERRPQGEAAGAAAAAAQTHRFFHWFLEFPDIAARGGFDCILGNPPYMGGTHLSGTYGYPFCHYVKWEYAPAGLSDLVAYFVRRIFTLLRPGGFTAFITTNSIKDGDIRKDGLEQVLAQGGTITMAVRGVKWPGRANLVVSLLSMRRGEWRGKRLLDGREVAHISAFFEDHADEGAPLVLAENRGLVYEGSHVRGDGFLLTHEEAGSMLAEDPRNEDVVFPVINGQEINNHPDQQPDRSIINFFDWPIGQAQAYNAPFQIALDRVKPERELLTEPILRRLWWQYERTRVEAYRRLRDKPRCFVVA
ncbi:MAG TPA: restriction endonuclease, partial [Candidatus Hydrogenedentes bacterium]|nr:restriction endonuclease [Candidatus Hydrogenedentota bacterium]